MRTVRNMKSVIATGLALVLHFGAYGCKKTSEAPEASSEDAIAVTPPVELKADPKPLNLTTIEPSSKCDAVPPDASGAGNLWGFPETCACSAGFSYNPVSGLCDGFPPLPSGSKLAKNPSVSDLVPTGSCTNDLNSWANPSSCECPSGARYNPVSARCDAKKQ